MKQIGIIFPSLDAALKLPFQQGWRLLTFYNSLLLCSSLSENDKNTNFHICNPSTKRFLTLPKPFGDGISTTIFDMNLAFDPSRPTHYKAVSALETVLKPSMIMKLRFTHSRLVVGSPQGLLSFLHLIRNLRIGCSGIAQFIGTAQQREDSMYFDIEN